MGTLYEFKLECFREFSNFKIVMRGRTFTQAWYELILNEYFLVQLVPNLTIFEPGWGFTKLLKANS